MIGDKKNYILSVEENMKPCVCHFWKYALFLSQFQIAIRYES